MSHGLLKPCLTCGVPTRNASRCDEHEAEVTARMKAANERTRVRASTKERGLDGAWKRLSVRARRMQAYCSDCGETDPSKLETDHTPEAWHTRLVLRRFITLAMVDVVCGRCNVRRGSARPGSPRYEAWLAEQSVPA
ncbi:5-methylcytosine-specific restriction endonuclease McrA [Aeromicrobium fastidiosum]|nr:5-methylcytosine-specific restriction endonuclease McrA [Aeromicrobium fastidiosum]